LSHALIGVSGVLNDVIETINSAQLGNKQQRLICLNDVTERLSAHKPDAFAIQAHLAGAVQVQAPAYS
jgi:hypothetical protein